MFKFFKKPSVVPGRQRRESKQSDWSSTGSSFVRVLDTEPMPLPEVTESCGESGWSLWDESLLTEPARH